ncbi:fimbrillin family protein [Segatella paludivivens]|uniref:fimbrillin family protein n=1 Tax=Segatella paludivivens TaxID=185294 RepID=UPI0003AA048A|nr:fimbrillin family protein [Segatella paludivivens]
MIKKFLRGINVSLLLLIIIYTFCSCANELNVFEGNNNKQINFSVSVPEWKNTDSLITTKTSRAMPVGGSSLSTSNTFNLIADQNDGSGNYSTLINSQAVTYTNNIWKTSKEYYWSGIANKTISFYAYYPSTISNVSHTAGSSPTLSYTVPDNVSDQIDIMTATNNNVSGNTNSSTPLTFNHIFSAVQFNIGSSGMPNGTITGISLNNILYKGTYNFNGTWTQDATTKKSFSQTVSSSTAGSTVITSGATTFMMMPQILGSDASITVTYSNGGTLTQSIAGTWTAGNIYAYNVSKTISVANFDYTGGVQTYTVPITGTYKIECWGGQGGSATYNATVLGGKGGYSYGNIMLTKDKKLYISIGGAGANGTTMNTTLGGWNGGASRVGTNPDHIVGGGGGCTSIQSTFMGDGQLKNYETVKDIEVLIVAGGGGGGFWRTASGYIFSGVGGNGGGITGENGTSGWTETSQPWGSGGTQTSGGTNSYDEPGSFGMGGGDQNLHAGGGGGWYGGGAGYGGAGGGSGHLNSNLISGNTGMGNGVHSGNGYARITFISAN